MSIGLLSEGLANNPFAPRSSTKIFEAGDAGAVQLDVDVAVLALGESRIQERRRRVFSGDDEQLDAGDVQRADEHALVDGILRGHAIKLGGGQRRRQLLGQGTRLGLLREGAAADPNTRNGETSADESLHATLPVFEPDGVLSLQAARFKVSAK